MTTGLAQDERLEKVWDGGQGLALVVEFVIQRWTSVGNIEWNNGRNVFEDKTKKKRKRISTDEDRFSNDNCC